MQYGVGEPDGEVEMSVVCVCGTGQPLDVALSLWLRKNVLLGVGQVHACCWYHGSRTCVAFACFRVRPSIRDRATVP